MDSREIALFLRAKGQQRLDARLNVAGVIAVALVPLFLLANVSSAYLWGTVLGVLMAAFAATSDLLSGSWRVSRQDLLEIIEAQVNRDPEALRYINSRR